jgi:transposase-like protein
VPQKNSTEKAVRGIRRKTRRRFSAEEKIRFVLEGLRGEESIASLCRREGIAANLFTRGARNSSKLARSACWEMPSAKPPRPKSRICARKTLASKKFPQRRCPNIVCSRKACWALVQSDEIRTLGERIENISWVFAMPEKLLWLNRSPQYSKTTLLKSKLRPTVKADPDRQIEWSDTSQ